MTSIKVGNLPSSLYGTVMKCAVFLFILVVLAANRCIQRKMYHLDENNMLISKFILSSSAATY